MNLFGKKKSSSSPTPGISNAERLSISETIQTLKTTLVTLEKKERHLEQQQMLYKQQALVKFQAKDVRAAKSLLKRSKMYERQRDQTIGVRDNIDVQIISLESAASNEQVYQSMSLGNAMLKKVNERKYVSFDTSIFCDILSLSLSFTLSTYISILFCS
jgi:uncharacterized membrane protein